MEFKVWSCMHTYPVNNRSFGRDGLEEISEIKWDASSLLVCIMNYPFFLFLYFWSLVLTGLNDAQKYVQEKVHVLDQCVKKLKALTLICKEKHDSLVTEVVKRAMQICKSYDISTERTGRWKMVLCEKSSTFGLNLIQEINWRNLSQ